MEERSQGLQVRQEKLKALRAKGIEPFEYSFDPTKGSTEAISVFEASESTGSLSDEGYGNAERRGGRIVSWRDMGKSSFAHLEDGQGQVQVYFMKDALGDDQFEALDLLDLGDWIGTEGRMFRTRTGEVTIRAKSWKLLTKSLRPLPFGKVETDAETGRRVVHSGFSDQEMRYRQRYADLAVNPEVREVFRLRSRVITALRKFLDGQGFLEVETPVLQPLYGGASAKPFVTNHNALNQTMYLRVADELYLKRLIVGGMDRVYEISKDFRNEGLSRYHNPEFTMLEWYQAFTDYDSQMQLVEQMVQHVLDEVLRSRSVMLGDTEINFNGPFERLGLVDALSDALGADVHALEQNDLRLKAEELQIPDLEGAGTGKLIDKLLVNL